MSRTSLIGFSAFAVFCMSAVSLAQDIIIADFKAPANACDYIIIAPAMFTDGALRLAQHRNSFAGDDVERARVADVQDILDDFPVPDTMGKHHSLWYALNYAVQNWDEAPEYAVFIGDDSIGVDSDTIPWSEGPIPTFIQNVRIYPKGIDYTMSDGFYSMAACSLSDIKYSSFNSCISTLCTGRIPCENTAQLDAYINKVMAFDTKRKNGPWHGSALLCADDAFQDTLRDPLWSSNPHALSCELIGSLLPSHMQSKVYLGRFLKDAQGIHSAAKSAFFASANRGAAWWLYMGHGHSNMLSDEKFLLAGDDTLFRNDSMPAVFMSMSCSNGAFQCRWDSSMCKKFLLKETGGCIAYIAAPIKTYASPNERLAKSFFRIVGEDSVISIGRMLRYAFNEYRSKDAAAYSILGDPALQVSVVPDSLEYHLDYHVSDGWRINCAPLTGSGDWKLYYVFSRPVEKTFLDDSSRKVIIDSTIDSATVLFGQQTRVQLPTSNMHDTLKVVLYAWNSTSEARSVIMLNINELAALPSFAKARAQGDLTMSGNVLIAAFGEEHGVLELIDCRGKQVVRIALTPRGRQCNINLASLNVAAGNYIARLVGQSVTISRRIAIIP